MSRAADNDSLTGRPRGRVDVREAVRARMGGTPASPGAAADAIESEVLQRVRPDAEQLRQVSEVCQRLVERATTVAREQRFPLVRCLVAGSAARSTFLRDRLDLDFFLLFPPTLPRPELERMGLALGELILSKTETRYAEHPYRRGQFEGFTVDAVPGYAIEDPSHPLTAVDRTPFHNAYLLAHQTPSMVDHVILTKQFLRALGIYGSEARKGGFSGYLVELLVLKFQTLRQLLEEARAWRIPVRLLSRPNAAPRVPEDVALVLDDPVDADRNVATALTRRNLALFILAAGEYLQRPRAESFTPVDLPHPGQAEAIKWLKVRQTHVGVLALPRPAAVDDILYPQLRKAERAVAEEATRLGFRVFGTASAAGGKEVLVLLEVDHVDLPGVRVQEGPPAGIDRTGDYLAKWSDPRQPVLQGPYVGSDGRLMVDVRREERRLEPLLSAALDRLPLGKDLRDGLSPQARFLPLDEVPGSPHLDEALGELLAKRLPWIAPRVPSG